MKKLLLSVALLASCASALMAKNPEYRSSLLKDPSTGEFVRVFAADSGFVEVRHKDKNKVNNAKVTYSNKGFRVDDQGDTKLYAASFVDNKVHTNMG